jgi:hypothetical protein
MCPLGRRGRLPQPPRFDISAKLRGLQGQCAAQQCAPKIVEKSIAPSIEMFSNNVIVGPQTAPTTPSTTSLLHPDVVFVLHRFRNFEANRG